MDIGSLTGELELDDNLSSGLTIAISKVKQFADSFDGMVGGIIEGGAAITAAITGIGATIVALGVKGSTIQGVTEAFDRLAGQAGTTGDALREALDAGLKDTTSNMTNMQATMKLLSSGMQLSTDQATLMGEASRALGKATGGDAASGLAIMSGALLTGRTRQLQMQIGLIDTAAGEKKFADSLGVTVKQLDAAGLLEGKRIAIMDATQKYLDRLGESQLSFKERVQQVTVAIEEWGAKLAMTVATSPHVLAAFDAIAGAIAKAFGGDSTRMLDTIVGWINKFADVVTRYAPPIIAWIGSVKDKALELWPVIVGWVEAFEEAAAKYVPMIVGALTFIKDGVVSIFDAVTAAWDLVPDWFKHVAEQAGETAAALYLLNGAVGTLTGSSLLQTTANLAQILGVATTEVRAFSAVLSGGAIAEFFGMLSTFGWEAVTMYLGGMGTALASVGTWFTGVAAAVEAFGAALLALATTPIALAIGAVALFVGGMRLLTGSFDFIKTPIKGAWQEIEDFATIVIGVASTIKDAFTTIGSWIADVFIGLTKNASIQWLVSTVAGLLADIRKLANFTLGQATGTGTAAKVLNYNPIPQGTPGLLEMGADYFGSRGQQGSIPTRVTSDKNFMGPIQGPAIPNAPQFNADENSFRGVAGGGTALGSSAVPPNFLKDTAGAAATAKSIGDTEKLWDDYFKMIAKGQQDTLQVTLDADQKEYDSRVLALDKEKKAGLDATQYQLQLDASYAVFKLKNVQAIVDDWNKSETIKREMDKQTADQLQKLQDATAASIKKASENDIAIHQKEFDVEQALLLKEQQSSLRGLDLERANADSALNTILNDYNARAAIGDKTAQDLINDAQRVHDQEIALANGTSTDITAITHRLGALTTAELTDNLKTAEGEYNTLKKSGVASLDALAKAAKKVQDAQDALHPQLRQLSTDLDSLSTAFTQVAQVAGSSFGGIAKATGEFITNISAATKALITLDTKQTTTFGKISAAMSYASLAYQGVTAAVDFLNNAFGDAGHTLEALQAKIQKVNDYVASLGGFGHILEETGLSANKLAGYLFTIENSKDGAEVAKAWNAVEASLATADAKARNLLISLSMASNGMSKLTDGTAALEAGFADAAKAGTDAVGILSPLMSQVIAANTTIGTNSAAIATYIAGQITSAQTGIASALDVTDVASKKLAADQIAAATATGAALDTLNADMKVQQGIIDATKIHSQNAATAVSASLVGIVNAQMKAGASFISAVKSIAPSVTALQAQLTTAGYKGGAAFDFLAGMVKLATDPIAGPAITAVEGYTAGLVGLANAGQLTQEEFGGIAGQITDTEKNLESLGYTHGQVMAAIQPDLQSVWELQQKYGFAVNDSTQALIDEGLKSGAVGETNKSAAQQTVDAMNHVVDILTAIAHAFGVTLPNAAKTGVDKAQASINTLHGKDVTNKVTTVFDAVGNPFNPIVNLGASDVNPPALPADFPTFSVAPGQSPADAKAAYAAAVAAATAATGGMVSTAGTIEHFAKGGVVQPEYLSKGNVLPFTPRGTDVVPAMLTPGETVRTVAQETALRAGKGDQGDTYSITVHAIDSQSFADAMKKPGGGIDVMIHDISRGKRGRKQRFANALR